MIFFLVLTAGSVGALARFLIERIVRAQISTSFPVGTVVVNIVGSFAFGIAAGLFLQHGISSGVQKIVTIGLLGGFTTYSTFAYEVVELHFDGIRRIALLTSLLSMSLGPAACWMGLVIMGH